MVVGLLLCGCFGLVVLVLVGCLLYVSFCCASVSVIVSVVCLRWVLVLDLAVSGLVCLLSAGWGGCYYRWLMFR